jgi:hypothetical protein
MLRVVAARRYVPSGYPAGSWRAMQWLLAGVGVIAFALSFLLPETIHSRGIDKIIDERNARRGISAPCNGIPMASKDIHQAPGSSFTGFVSRFQRWRHQIVWIWVDPLRPVRLLRYPNVLAIVSRCILP